MPARLSTEVRSSPALVVALHAGAFAALAWWSWLKWPDPLVDFGRELYVPWQIAGGKVLFKDIESLFGPLSPYVNALWFRLFGVSFLTLAALNLAILAAVAAGVHRLIRLSTDRFTATVASLVTLALFGFLQLGGIGNYNFVAPYSHEATHGLALSIGMFLALHASLDGRRIGAALVAGLAFGLLLLTKPETGVAAGVAAAVAFMAAGAVDRCSLRVVVPLFGAAATVPPLLFFAYFLRHMDAATALGGIARGWTTALNPAITANPFYLTGLGLDRLAYNAMWMVLMFGAFLASVAAMVAVSWAERSPSLATIGRRIGRVALVAVAPVAMMFGFARALPPIALGVIGLASVSFLRSRKDRASAMRQLPLLMWCAFAVLLLGKLGLNARFHHYGFYLALPAATVVVVLLCWFVPRGLETLGARDTSVQFRRLATAAIAVSLAPWLAISNNVYRTKTVAVGSGADRFLASQAPGYWQGVATRDALRAIESLRRPGDTLAVLPEGVMLNYLARLESPLRVSNLMPPELLAFGEEAVVGALRAAPPRFVILVYKDTSEYGYPPFGSNPRYGQQTHSWIAAHYEVIRKFGESSPTPSGHGLELLERK
jgi:hypothetical protein